MFTGFKDFLLRGNIVELAVAVVIGTAFTALVAAFTTSFIDPLIKRISGGGEVAGTIGIGKGQALDYGTFITAAITFVITAAVVYFLVVAPMKRLMERLAPSMAQEAPPAASEDVILLREIKDLLAGAEQGDRRSGGEHL